MVGAHAWQPVVSSTESARTEVLARIRTANAAAARAVPPIPREHRVAGTLTGGALLDLLAERVDDYRATVIRTGPDGVAGVVATLLAEHGVASLGVPPGIDRSLVPEGVVAAVDDGLGVDELDRLDGALTSCAVAIAETGTLVLDGSPDQGRRALTLVPDLHCVVVPADRVVHTVPEAVARLDPTRPLTWVSGPSATADIELQRVEGVHGPRALLVVIVEPTA